MMYKKQNIMLMFWRLDINTEALKKGFDGVYKNKKIIRELGPYYNNYFNNADDENFSIQ